MDKPQPRVSFIDTKDLDEDDARVNDTEHWNQRLREVQLWVLKEAAITHDHRIKLQLNKAEQATKKVCQKRSFAYSLCALIDPVLADLEHVLYQAASSLDIRSQID